jgi:aryl-alcohol dehydrogenase-like predicted oxidoreductase
LRFILGTASLGMDYGIANQGPGKLEVDSTAILNEAKNLGIQIVDTAPAYGKAEEIIGQYHTSNAKFIVHTKISGSCELTYKKALRSIQNSIRNLNVSKIDVLYFHSPELFLNGRNNQTIQIINSISETENVNKLGVSVYLEKEIEIISNDWPEIEVFQVPENILDQRLLHSEIISELSESGAEFHVRSIFLQGLALMDPQKVPKHFLGATDYLKSYQNYLLDNRMSRLEAALNYLHLLKWSSGFLVGVDTAEQLLEVLNFKNTLHLHETLPTPLPHPWVDPRNW